MFEYLWVSCAISGVRELRVWARLGGFSGIAFIGCNLVVML